jgi:hypothetical protein
VLLGIGWLWLRDSGLVAVDQVSVTGLSGTEAPRVRAALEGAARDMTTLHLRPDQLRTAVEPYPSIMAVDAHADFPHGLRHRRPTSTSASRRWRRAPIACPVAADGTLLRGSSTSGLPVVAVAAPPPGDTLSDKRTLRIVTPAGGRAARAARQGQPGLRRAARPDRPAGRRAHPCTSAAPTACARSGPPRRACSRTDRRRAPRISISGSPSAPPPGASSCPTPSSPELLLRSARSRRSLSPPR